MEKHPAVYIMASKRNGTLYTGVTSDLVRPVWEHREGLGDGFTARYGVKRLVYFEAHGDMYTAITREKQIKEWRRRWKVELIEGMNPEWRDLWETIVGGEPEIQPVIPAPRPPQEGQRPARLRRGNPHTPFTHSPFSLP